ncbi:hypothetical protein FIBSPDRAFT_530027 [Athelia psychrophila]|uniref:Uncharacterized protein n=1 Tax=Athelia psychrophila TaxID=1759441 RepID=A0A166JGI3_9AGAM|nr:hypothetical protein FIBSPDRAFT_530027 [Fibularhizoctonia sp. CBS 109695]
MVRIKVRTMKFGANTLVLHHKRSLGWFGQALFLALTASGLMQYGARLPSTCWSGNQAEYASGPARDVDYLGHTSKESDHHVILSHLV